MTTTPDSGRRRNRTLAIAFAAALLALTLLIALVQWLDSDSDGTTATRPGTTNSPVNNTPADLAVLFVQRHAIGDPAVCDLATEQLRKQLSRDGRCAGTPSGSAPQVTVLFAKTCGDRTGVNIELSENGKVGAPYAKVGLELAAANQWQVRSLLPINDRNAITPYECAPSSQSYGG